MAFITTDNYDTYRPETRTSCACHLLHRLARCSRRLSIPGCCRSQQRQRTNRPCLLRRHATHHLVGHRPAGFCFLSIPILLLHTRVIDYMAGVAAKGNLSAADLAGPGAQLVVTAIAAVAALLVATILSLYKPRGLTPYGWRRQYKKTEEHKP
jgi:hypothetical protein